MSILGIHHLTAVCSNAQRTVDFYRKMLGLRLVKKTVNFDDPGAYHLYFGDEEGHPGTLITFFEWSQMPKGHTGIGATHHLAFIVESKDAQLMWKRWLTDQGVDVTGPYDRNYFTSIYFVDPDGLILEIATRLPGWTTDEAADKLGTQLITPAYPLTIAGRDEEEIARTTWSEQVPAITVEMLISGIHHITAIASDIQKTNEFYTQVLGMRLVKRTVNYDNPDSPHYYFGVGDGKPGTIITYFGYPHGTIRSGKVGIGMTHHFAFAVENDEVQLEWHNRLEKAGVPVTEVLDRIYFKSIYFQDPDGHILEIATNPPGFLIDEEKKMLGSTLKLPRWLEPSRGIIEESLSPIT